VTQAYEIAYLVTKYSGKWGHVVLETLMGINMFPSLPSKGNIVLAPKMFLKNIISFCWMVMIIVIVITSIIIVVVIIVVVVVVIIIIMVMMMIVVVVTIIIIIIFIIIIIIIYLSLFARTLEPIRTNIS